MIRISFGDGTSTTLNVVDPVVVIDRDSPHYGNTLSRADAREQRLQHVTNHVLQPINNGGRRIRRRRRHREMLNNDVLPSSPSSPELFLPLRSRVPPIVIPQRPRSRLPSPVVRVRSNIDKLFESDNDDEFTAVGGGQSVSSLSSMSPSLSLSPILSSMSSPVSIFSAFSPQSLPRTLETQEEPLLSPRTPETQEPLSPPFTPETQTPPPNL
jgi:hypothetical protein